MSKILITGMSAPHTSQSAIARSMSFGGAIGKVLELHGHEVTQIDPEVSWNTKHLDQYDSILVGVSPLTSLSANRVYGALSVIDVARDLGKLSLFIDAPEPTRITASLRALSKTPSNIVKPFYSYRKGFTYAAQPNILDSFLETIEWLLNEEWPNTLYPSLPWDENTDKVSAQLPNGAANSLKPINVDSYMLHQNLTLPSTSREKWVVDNHASSWSKKVINSLQKPTSPMKWNKGWTDDQVFDQIARSIGAIINPHQTGGLWWTYRYIQALNAHTPVVTEWREAGRLDSSWSHIASAIEEMSQNERDEVSRQQFETYVGSVPNKRDAAIKLTDSLNLYTRKVQHGTTV